LINTDLVLNEMERLSKNGWHDKSISTSGYKYYGSAESILRVSFPEDSWSSEIGNKEGSGPWAIFRSELVANTLAKFNKELLWEVGAGDGNMALPLRNSSIETICIEPQEQGALVLSKEGFTTYRAFLNDLELPKDSIEAFGCFDVLEHLEEPNILISEMYRTLIPGGLLLITVPAHQWLYSHFDRSIGHFRRYSKKSLLMELDGFEIEEVRYIFPSLVLPAFLLRRLPYLISPQKGHNQREASARQMSMMKKVSPAILKLFRIENGIRTPFGLSIYCVARKPFKKRSLIPTTPKPL
jgi:SAM-dependent methyltransferase